MSPDYTKCPRTIQNVRAPPRKNLLTVWPGKVPQNGWLLTSSSFFWKVLIRPHAVAKYDCGHTMARITDFLMIHISAAMASYQKTVKAKNAQRPLW
jgi:hypothetical protein